MRIVSATANPDKVAEIEAILGAGFELTPRPVDLADVVEDADTLEGNARLKAQAVGRFSGEPALADDTGLEVDALDGAPGVHSARYAGAAGDARANIAKLLGELARVGALEPEQRRARFRTVAFLLFPDGREVMAEGVVEGSIAPVERGSGGFGYDSVFVPDGGDGRTFAEMSADEKNLVSHRGRAFRSLAARLRPTCG